MEMQKSVTVGIVTYNHAEYIEKTLHDIDAYIAAAIPTHVIIWDNGSADETVEIARYCAERSSCKIEVIACRNNLGFGRAHNEILKKCHSDYHLIYNPDLYATQGSIEPLLDVLNSDSEVMIATPRFNYPDGSLQPLCRRDPGVLDLFLRFFAVGPLKRLFSSYLEYATLQDVGYDNAMDVPITSGAMMCMRTSDILGLGGFDERFFVYFEDYDLCRQVRQVQKKIRFVPSSIFIHEWKRESRKSFKAVKLLFSGAFTYFSKWGYKF